MKCREWIQTLLVLGSPFAILNLISSGSRPGPRRDSPVGCTWFLALTCGSRPGPCGDSPVGYTWFLALTCGSHPGPRRDSPVGCIWFPAVSERNHWSWWSGRTHYKTHVKIILQILLYWTTALFGQSSFTAKFFVQLITAFLPERFTSRGLFTPSECENILKNQQLTSKIFFAVRNARCGRQKCFHRHRRSPPPRDGYCSGRYVSYWNAFLSLFVFAFTRSKQSKTSSYDI